MELNVAGKKKLREVKSSCEQFLRSFMVIMMQEYFVVFWQLFYFDWKSTMKEKNQNSYDDRVLMKRHLSNEIVWNLSCYNTVGELPSRDGRITIKVDKIAIVELIKLWDKRKLSLTNSLNSRGNKSDCICKVSHMSLSYTMPKFWSSLNMTSLSHMCFKTWCFFSSFIFLQYLISVFGDGFFCYFTKSKVIEPLSMIYLSMALVSGSTLWTFYLDNMRRKSKNSWKVSDDPSGHYDRHDFWTRTSAKLNLVFVFFAAWRICSWQFMCLYSLTSTNDDGWIWVS